MTVDQNDTAKIGDFRLRANRSDPNLYAVTGKAYHGTVEMFQAVPELDFEARWRFFATVDADSVQKLTALAEALVRDCPPEPEIIVPLRRAEGTT